jgi:hypothetical protein
MRRLSFWAGLRYPTPVASGVAILPSRGFQRFTVSPGARQICRDPSRASARGLKGAHTGGFSRHLAMQQLTMYLLNFAAPPAEKATAFEGWAGQSSTSDSRLIGPETLPRSGGSKKRMIWATERKTEPRTLVMRPVLLSDANAGRHGQAAMENGVSARLTGCWVGRRPTDIYAKPHFVMSSGR